MSERFEVTVVGSGFAGSILARAVARAGRRVALIERGQHPRFALGESSTPLAAIALERLAERYGLPDLRALAAYGRWLSELPEVGRGLKRGFTFLAHRAGRPFEVGREEESRGAGRLLVAASPNDEVADSHWLRADVDAHLAARAAAEGVDYRDGVELEAAEETGDGVRLTGRRGGRLFDLVAGFVVDASGAARFLGRHLPVPEASAGPRLATSLLYGHFEGAPPLAEAAPALAPESTPPGPYPDERAAVHHLLEEGWMYALRFDSGVVSAGIELPARPGRRPLGVERAEPEAAFRRIAGRYPTLAAQLGSARAVEPVRFVPRLQYRLSRAAGPRWLLLPGAFAATGPLFSTGIAWSLVAVERAARMLEEGLPPEPAELQRYDDLLAREADWIDRLVAGGLRARRRFELFSPWSFLYFTAASFAEARQRLLDRDEDGEGPWCREPFLGAGDPVLGDALAEAEEHLERALAEPGARSGGGTDAAFRRRVLRAVAPRDLVGFDLPGRRGLHPVDLEVLVERSHLLGLDRDRVRAALPRLRGAASGSGERDTIRPSW